MKVQFADFFWPVALVGVLPAAISTTLTPTHWCLNLGNPEFLFQLPPFGCLGGHSIPSTFLNLPFVWVYVFALLLGFLICVMRRWLFRLVSLLPLFALSAFPFLQSIAPDEPTNSGFLPKTQITQLHVSPSVLVKKTYFGQEFLELTEPEIRRRIEQVLRGYSEDTVVTGNYQTLEKSLQATIPSIKELTVARQMLAAAKKKLEKNKQEIAHLKRTEIDIASMRLVERLDDKPQDQRINRRRDLAGLVEEVRQKIAKKKKLKSELETGVTNAKSALQKARSNFKARLARLNDELSRAASIGPNQDIRRWTLIYSLFAFITLFLYCLFNSLRSIWFYLSAFLVVAVPLSFQLWTSQQITVASALFALLFLIYPLLLYLITAATLRLIVLAVSQNLPAIRQLPTRPLLRFLATTFLLWIPIAIAISVGIWMSAAWHNRAEQAVYSLQCSGEGLGIFQCESADDKTLVPRVENKSLEENVDSAVDAAFQRQKTQLANLLTLIQGLSSRTRREVPDILLNEFDQAFPDGEGLKRNVPSLRPPSCSWYQIGCQITRHIKIAIVDSYQDIRNRYRSVLEAQIKELAEKSDESLQESVTEMEAGLTLAMHDAEQTVRGSVARIFWTNRTLNLIMSMILIVISIKSLAYIFTRVAFKGELGQAVSMDFAKVATPQPTAPRIEAGYEPEYALCKNDYGKFYIKPGLSPSGRTQGVAWPQPTRAALRRVFAGCYKMIVIDPAQEEKGAATIQSSEGKQFVEWELGPSEEVLFSLRNLAGISETIEIETHVSLNLMAMAFGRMFYSVAKGPGILVLRTYGRPDVYVDNDDTKSIDPARYIAWSRTATFSINSSTKPKDIYFHVSQLSFAGGGGAIVDVSEQGLRRAGAIRFIPPVLLPI